MHDPDIDRFATRCVHAGQEPDPATGAIMTPIYQTSTYVQAAPGDHKGWEYSRTGNPTRAALEANIASLEGGRHGLAFSSGMGAADCVLNLLSAGDHVVAGNDLYGGTYRIFKTLYEKFGVTFTLVDARDVGEVAGALTDDTRLVWIETPSNPLLGITDLDACVEAAHDNGSLAVVDNTFATPALQNPLRHGADIVLHSTTKYLGGHSDVVGGALVVDDDALRDRLAHFQNTVGAVPGPLDCFLVLRGTKTLDVRMQRHCDNAERVVAFLQEHPKVTRIFWPGLPDHPGHDAAARQMSRFGAMLSFEIDGDLAAGVRAISATEVFALAESLGGVESLIEHPAAMTHASIPPEERAAAGLSDGLIRLSVGIEDADDLLADLEQALARI